MNIILAWKKKSPMGHDILERSLLAKEHGRSLNAEIVWALRKYIKGQEAS